MVKAATEGTPLDPQLGKNALARSLHNNYFTLPVLFVMVSNHFPSTFGHALPVGHSGGHHAGHGRREALAEPARKAPDRHGRVGAARRRGPAAGRGIRDGPARAVGRHGWRSACTQQVA